MKKEKLKMKLAEALAENENLLRDLRIIVTEKPSFINAVEVRARWQSIFGAEDMIMSGHRTMEGIFPIKVGFEQHTSLFDDLLKKHHITPVPEAVKNQYKEDLQKQTPELGDDFYMAFGKHLMDKSGPFPVGEDLEKEFVKFKKEWLDKKSKDTTERKQMGGNAVSAVKEFQSKKNIVKAIQLKWENWNEVCDFIPKNLFIKGTYADSVKDIETTSANGSRIAVWVNPQNKQLVIEGEWLVKHDESEDGNGFGVCSDESFNMLYEPVESRKAEAKNTTFGKSAMGNASSEMSEFEKLWRNTYPNVQGKSWADRYFAGTDPLYENTGGMYAEGRRRTEPFGNIKIEKQPAKYPLGIVSFTDSNGHLVYQTPGVEYQAWVDQNLKLNHPIHTARNAANVLLERGEVIRDYGCIKSFEINECTNRIWAKFGFWDGQRSHPIDSLSKIELEKVKFEKVADDIAKTERQPLFKAKDGIDIYEGDDYFYIDGMEKICKGKASLSSSNWRNKFKNFESAESHIARSQKSISFNELKEYLRCATSINERGEDFITKSGLLNHFKPKSNG